MLIHVGYIRIGSSLSLSKMIKWKPVILREAGFVMNLEKFKIQILISMDVFRQRQLPIGLKFSR
jgi:hypothetical protein